jgi:hypothetical protein
MDTMTLTVNRTLTCVRQRILPVPVDETQSSGFVLHVPLMSILWLFIGLVGALDTYLTVKYRAIMPQVEENPLGNLLMRLDGGDVSAFVGCKVAGTILALGMLAAIMRRARTTFAYAILVPVALAQLILLGYLLL